jgi:hypothetical protein
MDFGWDLGLGMPGAFGDNPYPPPAGSAPLAARSAGYVTRPNAGENFFRVDPPPPEQFSLGSFNLNYDEEGPMDRIDIGGPDQNQKYVQQLI